MNDDTATGEAVGGAAGSATADPAAAPRRWLGESPAGAGTATSLLVPFFACRDRYRRRLLAVLQLGAASFVLWILSLYLWWDDQTGQLVDDPVNLWFNCIQLGAFAAILHCVSRPRHRTAGAVAFVGLTVGLLYVIFENAFGMFTYNVAEPAAGFWLGIASYVVMLVAAVYAGYLVADECCQGCLPDRRPRSPWLVLGLGVLSIGWIVARFLPDYRISVRRAPVDGTGNALNETLHVDIVERGMVGRLEGAEFIPEIAGWVIFLLAVPLTAWVLRRQLTAAFVSGFLVYFVADIAAALAVNYGRDYTRDTNDGMRLTVDFGFGDGTLALVATTALFAIVVAAIYLTGSEHPDIGDNGGSDAAPAAS